MKKLLFIAACVAALSSCSQNEIQGPEEGRGKAIGFENYLGSATIGKGIDVATPDLVSKGFFVQARYNGNGSTFFGKEQFIHDGAVYNSDPVYYWPANAEQLDFFAYTDGAATAPTNFTITSFDGVTGNPTFTYTTETTGAAQKDLVVEYLEGASATTMGNDPTTGNVKALRFDHALAKISATVKANTTNKNLKLFVSKIELTGMSTTGTCEVSTSAMPTWPALGLGTEDVAMELSLTNVITDGIVGITSPVVTEANANANALIVIPQNTTATTLKVYYQWKQKDDLDNYTTVVIDKSAGVEVDINSKISAFEANIFYTLNLDITTDDLLPIQFTADVVDRTTNSQDFVLE